MEKSKVIRTIILVPFIWCLYLLCAATCGDVNANGNIDIVDALLIARYYVGLNPENFDATAADVNADSGINITDALLVARFYVGLISALSCPDETPSPTAIPGSGPYVAYLLAYFRNENEKLHYAVSTDPDARSFTALNGDNPVMQQFVRDPYIHRLQNGTFAFVHTTAMSGRTIAVWRSGDLINWNGGTVDIMTHTDTDKCWAPEFVWCREENLYYIFWASNTSARSYNVIWRSTTADFINVSTPSMWYDIGDYDIDLTILYFNGEYIGFHKVGLLDDYNRLSRTSRLSQGFPSGQEVFTDGQLPTEGPEAFQLIGQTKWHVIVDPFDYAMEVHETTDFQNFTRIQVTFPSNAKHCSVVQITQSELDALRARYP
ncbi:MAG: family 43 glycosylhydrolase [Spirochaetales bacterium]|nr:family 43 glycosylhydrolase [Spirochaetales bacterium]